MTTTAKPVVIPSWTTGQATQIAQPTPSLQASGFTAGQRPAFQTLNFLLYNLSQWVQYLDAQANGQVSGLEIGSSIRLTGGGTWAYSASTNTLSWSDVFVLSTPSIPDADNTLPAGSVNITPGQLAYVVANLPFATTGNTTSGSTALTQLPYELGIVVGQAVTGAGIPNNTTVTAVADGQVTISNAATATASNVYLTFTGTATPVVKVAAGTSLMPSPNVIIIAACTTNGVIVGVNSGQMRLLDGEQKRLLGTGYIHTVLAQTGQALNAGQPVYISQGGGDADSITGTTTSGSSTLTNTGSTANIAVGSVIVGAGLPQPTTVTAIGASSLSLSNAATSSGTATFLASRIPGGAYAADASSFYGAIRGNVAGVVTTTPVLSQTAPSFVRYMTSGVFANYSGLTPGSLYYVNPATPGAITSTLPSTAAYNAPVGVALNQTTLFVQPLTASRPPTADAAFNDLSLSAISGSAFPVGINITSGGNNVFAVNSSGNLTMQGVLNVLGATNLQSLLSTFGGITSNGTISSTSFVSSTGFKTCLPMATLSNATIPAQGASSTPLLDGSGASFVWVAPFSGSIVGFGGYNTGTATAQGAGVYVSFSVIYGGTESLFSQSTPINGGSVYGQANKGAYSFPAGTAISCAVRSRTAQINNSYVHFSLVVEMGA